jgi:hypothetical protein
MKPGGVGMIFDRALTPEQLDVGLRVATSSGGSEDSRRLLTVALRDHVSAKEAEGKTKKCLTRVWLRPPAESRAMIRWAVAHQHLDPERVVLHLGSILATFPFAGLVAALVGRQLYLEGQVDPAAVRAQARAKLGDRSTIDIGARKVVTTLRYLGLLSPVDGGSLVLGKQPIVPAELSGWVMHALLLTRQVGALGIADHSSAYELASVKTGADGVGNYPLLEEHTEGHRTVVVSRV